MLAPARLLHWKARFHSSSWGAISIQSTTNLFVCYCGCTWGNVNCKLAVCWKMLQADLRSENSFLLQSDNFQIVYFSSVLFGTIVGSLFCFVFCILTRAIKARLWRHLCVSLPRCAFLKNCLEINRMQLLLARWSVLTELFYDCGPVPHQLFLQVHGANDPGMTMWRS